MRAETAVARQSRKGATDGIEVALTPIRRGTAYSADELGAVQTADRNQYKRIMRRRSMNEKVAEAASALKEAFRTKVLVADDELPAPVKAHLQETINLTSWKGRKVTGGEKFTITCFFCPADTFGGLVV